MSKLEGGYTKPGGIALVGLINNDFVFPRALIEEMHRNNPLRCLIDQHRPYKSHLVFPLERSHLFHTLETENGDRFRVYGVDPGGVEKILIGDKEVPCKLVPNEKFVKPVYPHRHMTIDYAFIDDPWDPVRDDRNVDEFEIELKNYDPDLG